MAGKAVRPEDAASSARAAERLAALAAEGRERQAAALAAEEAEERRIRRKEARELERLLRPNIRLALLDSPRGKAPPLTAIACKFDDGTTSTGMPSVSNVAGLRHTGLASTFSSGISSAR